MLNANGIMYQSNKSKGCEMKICDRCKGKDASSYAIGYYEINNGRNFIQFDLCLDCRERLHGILTEHKFIEKEVVK